MTLLDRSLKKELLDQDDIPFADIQQNMRELNFINKWLGGHSITIAGFKQLLQQKKKISVCEIGCGGGDNLVAINNFCKRNNVQLFVTGIDIKPECIAFAKTRKIPAANVNWIVNDYQKAILNPKPDIIFSSLFCHHFNNEQLISQLRWMKDNSNVGFFINDLHRNFLAYYSITFLTRLFSNSYLVKNDAPLSVARGFKHHELKSLCKKAMAGSAEVVWKWAFRYLVIFKHEQTGAI
jgi:2-polyprenyl-3-methyl-5-hydroxy-6-metoxy-1,4-benzoquinol methylase